MDSLRPRRKSSKRASSSMVRGDGDQHMRGMSCLLTGKELFPANIQGGSHTPAGWASGISIDQELKNFLQPSRNAHPFWLPRVRGGGSGATTPSRTIRTSNLESVEKLNKINEWFCGELAYLTHRLASTPEPGTNGSLLDHTLDNIPFVLLGGKKTPFKMGRSLKFESAAHNRLWMDRPLHGARNLYLWK